MVLRHQKFNKYYILVGVYNNHITQLYMRKLLFTAILFFAFYATKAQQLNVGTNYIGKYYWTEVTTITACSITGENLPGTVIDNTETTIVDQLFNVIKVIVDSNKDEYAIIRILNYDPVKQKEKFLNYNFEGDTQAYKNSIGKTLIANDQQRYFKIDVKDLQLAALKYSYLGGALSGGVINFPFKFRLQDGTDFSTAFNLGAALGYTFPHYDYRDFTYTLLVASAINNVNLDASSVSQNADKLNTTNDFSALSFAIGGMVQYDKFQAGIFIGLDKLGKLNNDTFQWKYQNKPWISFGFGYSIFSVQKEKSNSDQPQQH